MKRSLLSIVAGVALGTCVVQAEVAPLSSSAKVKLNELPPAAQNAIKAQAGSAEIEDVEKGTLNGRAVYEAAFKKNGQHTELRVAEDGTIVDTIVAGQSAPASTTTAASRAPAGNTSESNAYGAGFGQHLTGTQKISFRQVSENVRKLVRQRSGSAEIHDVDKGMWNGAPAYEIAYQKDGKHMEFRVMEDGTKAKEVANGVQIYWHAPIAFDQVPANIQNVVKSRLGVTPIKVALRGQGTDGQGRDTPFYRFIYNKNGQEMELRVRQNGAEVKEFATGGIIKDSAGSELKK